VPETELGKVKVGAIGHVTADGVPASDGTVTFVSSSAEFTPTRCRPPTSAPSWFLPGAVQIKGHHGAYKPGMRWT